MHFPQVHHGFLLLSLFLTTVLADDPCNDIINEKQAIYWIGMLRSRFILITSTFMVYDLSTSDLDEEGRKLHLHDPKPMDKAYPKLSDRMNRDSTGFFKGDQKRLCVVDATSEYLYVETTDREWADMYDLKSGATYHKKMKDHMDNQPSLWLSSNEPLMFYAFYYSSTSDPSGKFMKGRLMQENTLPACSILQMMGEKYYICRGVTTNDKIELKPKSCDKGKAEWSAVQGFATTNNMYVMATNRTVAVWAKSAYDKPGDEVTVYLVRYEDFFVCGRSKWLWIGLIVGALILFLVLCCLCFLFCCMRNKGRGPLLSRSVGMSSSKKSKSRSHSKRKSKHHKSKHRSKSTKKTRKGKSSSKNKKR